MAVCLLSLHAYRNWRADHRRGYTRRGAGYQPPDPDEVQDWDERAKHDPAKFEAHVQRQIIRIALDFCSRRRCRLHAVRNELGHTHLLLSWRGYSYWHEVMRRLKNLISQKLNEELNTPGRKWFVRGGRVESAYGISRTSRTRSRGTSPTTRVSTGARRCRCRSASTAGFRHAAMTASDMERVRGDLNRRRRLER